MKVREIMTADVGTCRPETNLAEAVKLMWENDCGALPVNVNLPFLDVTLRNKHAIQHYSFIFGNRYSRDLSGLLHTACDATRALPSPRVRREVRVLTMWTRRVLANPAESDLHTSSSTGTS